MKKKEEIIEFVKNMQTKDHVVLLYEEIRDKHDVLFTYLKTGLEKGEAAVYVASQETPEQIKQAMREFSIDVERYENEGALKVIDYRDWYLIGGSFSCDRTLDFWRELLDKSKSKGFKGLRVTGETACFFRNDMVKELMEYEYALHRVLDIPMTAICAYDSKTLASKEEWFDVLIELLNMHSTAIMLGTKGIGATTPSQILVRVML